MIQNIKIDGLKNMLKPQFVELIIKILKPKIILQTARGMGYQEKITEQVAREVIEKVKFINELGQEEEKEMPVTRYENVEKENPEKPVEYLACRYVDILFSQTMQALESDYRNHRMAEELNPLLEIYEGVESEK